MTSNNLRHSTQSHKTNTIWRRGFTLVEVLVVLVIMSIIVSILVVTLIGQQEKTRDSTRNSKATIFSEALEQYYDKNGEYPAIQSLVGKSASEIKDKLSLKDSDLLIFPGSASTTQASIVAPINAPSPTQIVYAGTADGAADGQCQTDPAGYCAKYQLRYKEESTDEVVTIDSRRNPYVKDEAACSGSSCLGAPSKPTVVGANLNSTQVQFTANGATCVVGTAEYQIRYNNLSANAGSMPTWPAAWLTSNTLTVAKSGNTSFYSQSRAQCVSGTSGGPVSAESDIHTLNIATPPASPSPSASATSNYTIQLTWQPVSGATSYSVTGAGNASSCTSSGCTVSGLAANTYYSFNVYATNSTGTSGPGAAAATTPPVSCNSPSTPYLSAGTGSSSSINLSWGSSSGDSPMTYYIYYGTGTNPTTFLATTSSTGYTAAGLSSSTTYYFKVFAQNNCSSSSYSNVANATTSTPPPTTPNTPSTPSVSVSGNSTSTWSWGAVYCNVGSPQYEYTYSNNLGGSASGSISGTSVSFTTNSEGITYTTSVRARCVNGSAVSGYSGSGSNSYKRPMSSYIIASSGSARLITATFAGGTGANQIWADANVDGVNGSCPSGTKGYIQYFVQINQYAEGDNTKFDNFGTSPVEWSGYLSATHYSWLTVGDMVEFKYRSWCTNNTTGERGPYARSDIFGNLHYTTARLQGQNQRGDWRRGCEGKFSDPYVADACVVDPGNTFGAF